MKVLLAASEVAPIIKLGGLGDVTGSLPKALERLGVNIDVIAPYFPFAKTQNIEIYKSIDLEVPFKGESNHVEVYDAKLPGSNVDVMLLKNAKYFSNYGAASVSQVSETEMFSFFDRAVTDYIESKFNTYDLIHCNDWHTGMITHLLQDELETSRPATLFTIHNLMYQGISKVEVLWDMGIIPGTHPIIDYDIADGDLNFMQQGISAADYINTVSPSYAEEILRGDYPGELTDILQAREARFCGILNGIDYAGFPRSFDSTNWKQEKKRYKEILQSSLNLTNDTNKPLFAFVGRIDPNQKGMDILLDTVETILDNNGQFVLLGSGDKTWEEKFTELGNRQSLKDNISINLKFDIELGTKIYSGSDFLMAPSKYEPCGLIQMIAMWYGSLPIVRSTGGLKDSVIDGQNGIQFKNYSSDELKEAVIKATKLYIGQETDAMVENAIKEDFSWNKSAVEYKKLYENVIKIRNESRF